MKNYENMPNEEIKEQLEWSDHHEFSYNYAIWAFEEIDRLNNIINKLEEYCWELKAMGCREGALDMLNKIEELKNGDNNE